MALPPALMGLPVGVAAWLLLGGSDVDAGLAHVWTARIRRVAREAVSVVGGLSITEGALRLPGWSFAADELVLHAPSWGLTRASACAVLEFAALALGVALSVLLGSLAGVPLALVSVGVILPLWSRSRRAARMRALACEVPDALRSLAGALGAGQTLSQAIGYVGSSGKGPMSREFLRASLMLSCGMPTSQVLAELSARVDVPGISLMVTALAVSQRTGAPLHGLFLRSARLVEQREELSRQLVAKTAQVRLSARVVTLLPAVMVLGLSLISADFRAGVASPVGVGCLVVAALLDVVALLVIRWLLREVG